VAALALHNTFYFSQRMGLLNTNRFEILEVHETFRGWQPHRNQSRFEYQCDHLSACIQTQLTLPWQNILVRFQARLEYQVQSTAPRRHY
jgi:hypothetical protein